MCSKKASVIDTDGGNRHFSLLPIQTYVPALPLAREGKVNDNYLYYVYDKLYLTDIFFNAYVF